MTNLFLSIDAGTIDWSRAQFALTAIYHWLFVPLTLGLAMEGDDPILATALRCKLCHGRSNGYYPRV